MSKSFGSREFEKCVRALGFTLKHISSSHAKYIPPPAKNSPGIRPFFIIQLGRRTYDPHSANRYISQLKGFGFTKEEIERNL